MSFHGGVIGAVAGYLLFRKKHKVEFYDLADNIMMPLAFALFLGRIANFINGELWGTITNVSWCVEFPRAEGCRHPSQLYESAKNLLIFFILFFMKTKKKFIALSIAALLMVTLGTSVSFAGKPEGKGGKVTVESATPNSVIQTKDEDVIIVGTGFDDGSSIKFLVTGTTDDSQIEVGPTQFISSTQLKVHIKTTGSTAVVDYDVEVQATSGRKGKGTTLFRVKSINPPNPAIAYTGGQEQQELFTMDADGDDLDRLAGGRNNDPQSISWLPDDPVVLLERI